MKLKQVLINLSVIALSCAAGLMLCEVGARLVLNPADYLSVEMVQDSILGATPSPAIKRSGFDAWGFRNRRVPETADIVAIGDSHTYGNTATMEDSWPYVLGRITGRQVYNMGMGGYGPNQYFHLLKTKALQLKPRMIICGLYMGDDFENAFLITYGLDHWAYLRKLPAGKADFDIWKTAPAELSWHKKIRIWLSRHSLTYQLVFHGPFMGQVQGEAQIRHAAQLYDSATSLIVPEKDILEAFLPKGLLRNLDQKSPTVQEGMRITFELLKEMNDICRAHHVQFLVVVIPTKERVFSSYLEHKPSLPLGTVIDSLIANERLAEQKLFQFLTDSEISYVDALPSLRSSLDHRLYARTAADMHPNRNGYRVIAESVLEALKSRPWRNGTSSPNAASALQLPHANLSGVNDHVPRPNKPLARTEQ
ncbi:MAG: hypothetical protein IT165_19535 [Bryobacterales bacterium]|nr:hypothetical protein [Bryobacterales bacterium]